MKLKPTENYEQLIERFTKRTAQLTARADELYDAYAEYVKIQEDLTRLQGSLQAVEYLHMVNCQVMAIMTVCRITNHNESSTYYRSAP